MRATHQSPKAQEAIAQFVSALRLARASELGICGNLLLAETILTPPTSTLELNLLAKIVAQQGRYREAIDLWKEAVLREPDNAAFQNAITFCEGAERSRTTLWRRLLWGLAASTVVLLILAGRSCHPQLPSARELKSPQPAEQQKAPDPKGLGPK